MKAKRSGAPWYDEDETRAFRVDARSASRRTRFWQSVIKAVEAQSRPAKSILGISGVSHPVAAIGVDEERKRLIVVAEELDGRSAATMRADVQAAVRDFKVLIVRPVFANPLEAARYLAPRERDLVGWAWLLTDSVRRQVHRSLEAAPPHDPSVHQTASAAVGVLDHNMNHVHSGEEREEAARYGLEIAKHDSMQLDRDLGVCWFPLYQLSQRDVQLCHRGTDIEAVRELLRREDIWQFFFPAPDHLALGLVDRGTSALPQIIERIYSAPSIGHPIGRPELLDGCRVDEIIAALQDRGMLVEGDVNVEITPQGRSVRQGIRFKPREGVLSRLLNRVSISFSLRDLFGQ